MEKLVQPEREICRFGWPAMVASGLALVIVLALTAWVTDIAMAKTSMRGFKDLALGTGMALQRPTSPLMRRITGETGGGINTTIAGSDENPLYHPQLANALWAEQRDHWSSNQAYMIALAYWKEAERQTSLMTDSERRMGSMTPAELTENRSRMDQYRSNIASDQRQALTYLVHAINRDPANAFYRWTLAELGELTEAAPTTEENYEARAMNRVPMDTCALLLYAERLQEEKKSDEALEAYSRALLQVRTEFRDGIGDDKGRLLGEYYLGKIVDGMQSALKSYSAWQKYVPDDSEVHLRVAGYLIDKSEEAKKDVMRQDVVTGHMSKQDEAADLANAAVMERKKGLEAGEVAAAKGTATPELLHLMGLAYMTNKDWENGTKWLQNAVDLRPKRTEWRLELAQLDWEAAKSLAADAKRLNLDAGNPDTSKEKAASDQAEAKALQARARNITDSAQAALDNLLDREPSNKDGLELLRTVRDTRVTMFE